MINLLRTAHKLEMDYETISRVTKQLELENSTAEEKIREIFSEIGVDIDLEELI